MNNNYTKLVLLSICLTGIFFSFLTFLFTILGILSFHGNLFSSIVLSGVPIYAILLSFVAPALGLSTYLFLNSKFPNNKLEKFSLSISNLLLGLCVAMLFFGYLKWYTAITFLLLLSQLLYIEYSNKLRFMYRFYRCYLALLIPFYSLCLFFKSQSFLMFNENASLKLKLVFVPIEAYFYYMGMLLMAVYVFELFKSKEVKTNG